MLISSGLPKWLWGMAMLYATYIRNHTPHKAIDMKTPYEKQFRTIPDISNLHPFGSIVYIKCTPKPNKLEDQAVERRWLGPEKESQGYYIYWLKKKFITVEFTNQPIQLSEEEDNDFIWNKRSLSWIQLIPLSKSPSPSHLRSSFHLKLSQAEDLLPDL
ncbi:hypothetical protein D9758_016583 [Tetrapyrgos nigripes]|uniref:Uncharacterized protein n=1 Tax=Tetrapyrgos nigripes TaxID=182062 RepID=A0A8H5C287_9AGAR|nr:hypothetical protein D9758_016583 [Tetrapyrgos nigripes]